jgi:hypothetical protein
VFNKHSLPAISSIITDTKGATTPPKNDKPFAKPVPIDLTGAGKLSGHRAFNPEKPMVFAAVCTELMNII